MFPIMCSIYEKQQTSMHLTGLYIIVTHLATISTKFAAVSKSRGSTDLLFSVVEWFRASRRVTDNFSTFCLSISKIGRSLFIVSFRSSRRFLVCNSNADRCNYVIIRMSICYYACLMNKCI